MVISQAVVILRVDLESNLANLTNQIKTTLTELFRVFESKISNFAPHTPKSSRSTKAFSSIQQSQHDFRSSIEEPCFDHFISNAD